MSAAQYPLIWQTASRQVSPCILEIKSSPCVLNKFNKVWGNGIKIFISVASWSRILFSHLLYISSTPTNISQPNTSQLKCIFLVSTKQIFNTLSMWKHKWFLEWRAQKDLCSSHKINLKVNTISYLKILFYYSITRDCHWPFTYVISVLFILLVLLSILHSHVLSSPPSSSEKVTNVSSSVLGIVIISLFPWTLVPIPSPQGLASSSYSSLSNTSSSLRMLGTAIMLGDNIYIMCIYINVHKFTFVTV